MPPDTDYTLAELASLADVSPRTIRYYVAQGLLPSPESAGPATRYPVAVLGRLRLIRQLQRQHLPLAEIRRQLAELSDDDIATLTAMPPEAPPPGSALDYVRAMLVPESPAPSRRSLLRGMTPGGVSGTGPRPPGLQPPPRYVMGESVDRSDALESRRLLLSAPEVPAHDAAELTPTAGVTTPERSQWERIVLEPDVELHVRRPLSRIANKRIDRLLAFARQLLEEDQP